MGHFFYVTQVLMCAIMHRWLWIRRHTTFLC